MLDPEVLTNTEVTDQKEVLISQLLIKKPTRVYCKGAHTPNHCDVIVDVGQRLEHVKKEGLCFNCLGKHRVSQCTSQARCKKCNSKHHTSICNPDNAKAKHTTPATTPASHKTQSSGTEPISGQVTKTINTVSATVAMADTQTSVLCNSGKSILRLRWLR